MGLRDIDNRAETVEGRERHPCRSNGSPYTVAVSLWNSPERRAGMGARIHHAFGRQT